MSHVTNFVEGLIAARFDSDTGLVRGKLDLNFPAITMNRGHSSAQLWKDEEDWRRCILYKSTTQSTASPAAVRCLLLAVKLLRKAGL
jgi:hypothetical protein